MAKAVLVIAVLVCGFAVYSLQEDPKEFAERMKQHMDVCVKETKVKPEQAEKAMVGEYAEDKELKCYVKCMMVKVGYMTEAGEFDVEFMKKHPRPGVDEAKAAAGIDKCKNSDGADVCEKAIAMAKCVHAEIKA